MSYLLKQITNWPDRAAASNWSVSELAKEYKISVRTLQRYFMRKKGKSPRCWIISERQRRAIELLRDGSTAKETAMTLGYQSQQTFTHAFRKHYGIPPSRHHEIGQIKKSQIN